MTSMFWGLRLEPGKRYSTTVDKSFHVSMAALDCSSVKGDEVLSIMLEEDEANIPYILCNLHKQKAMQARLDLNFMSGDRVTFFCKGQGVVHLSGYIVPDDDEFGPLGDEEGEEEEDEDEVEEEEECTEKPEITKGAKGAGKGKMNGVQVAEKRKTDEAQSPSKKKKVEQEEAESEDSDDDDEEEDEDMEGLDEEDEEDLDGIDEEDSNGSDEEDEESYEDEVETPAATTQTKKDKKNKQGQQQQQQQQQQQRTSVTPNAKQQTPKTPKTANGLPATNQQQSGKKDKKKGGESPAGTPKGNKSISEDSSPQKKNLEGGVTIKDVRVGNGQLCKPGRLATVYYTGRLKSNNKVFDSAMQGPGFKFKVGRGEVIKGWDIGVNGMKVGGKRVITCPPQMAYGAKGSPPTIPGNSTLVFEVELKALN